MRHHKKAQIKGVLIGILLGGVLIGGVLPAFAQTTESSEQTTETRKISKKKVKKIARSEAKKAVNKYADDIARREIGLALGTGGNIANAIGSGDVDKVDGFDANDLARAAFAATNDFIEASAPGTVLSVSITAPEDGVVLSWAGIDAWDTTGFSTAYACDLGVDGTTVTGTFRVVTVAALGEGNCSTSGAVNVGAGTHTITFGIPSYDAQNLGAASLQVLFVPFDGTGAAIVVP